MELPKKLSSPKLVETWYASWYDHGCSFLIASWDCFQTSYYQYDKPHDRRHEDRKKYDIVESAVEKLYESYEDTVAPRALRAPRQPLVVEDVLEEQDPTTMPEIDTGMRQLAIPKINTGVLRLGHGDALGTNMMMNMVQQSKRAEQAPTAVQRSRLLLVP